MNDSETKRLAKKFLIERYAKELKLNRITDASIQPFGFDATSCDLYSIASMEPRVGGDRVVAVNRHSGEVADLGIFGE